MALNPVLAADLIETVDTRFRQLSKMQPKTAYGIVASVTSASRTASVYVSGDAAPSIGFSYPAHLVPTVGDRVRVVIDPRGDRYIDQVLASNITAANPIAQQIEPMAASVGTGAYPHGTSIFHSADGATLGYPATFIGVKTIKVNSSRIEQYCWTHGGEIGQLWWRAGHTSTFGGDAFGPWNILTSASLAREITKTSTQSIAHGTWTRVIGWTTAWGGSRLIFDGTDNGIVLPVTGIYSIRGMVNIADTSSTGRRIVAIAINGTEPLQANNSTHRHSEQGLVESAAHYIEVNIKLQRNAGDKIMLATWHSAGVSLTLTTAALSVQFEGP